MRTLATSGVDAPQIQTAFTSSSPSTSSPNATINSPHRPHATGATQTTGVPAPSGADTPQRTRQERASKQAAQRHQPHHHAATAIREHRASSAGRGAVPSPTNTAATLGTAQRQMSPAPGPTGDPAQQLQTPPDASTRGRQPAASQAVATQAHSEPRPHHGTPIWPTEGPTQAPPEGPPQTDAYRYPNRHQRGRPLGIVHPHSHNPTESPSPRGAICWPRHKPSQHPSGTTTHKPGRQYGLQVRHLAVARLSTRVRTPTRTRRAPPSRLTPRGPPIREASPG